MLENPAWYTAYTPYQAEISQGRMEALVNFQTMVCELTGMAIAGSSMLDEATAAAEAMTLAMRVGKSKSTTLFVADDVLPQTLEVVRTRARPIGVSVLTGPAEAAAHADAFAVLLQYPGVGGVVRDLKPIIDAVHARAAWRSSVPTCSLVLLTPPGEIAPTSSSATPALRHTDGQWRSARVSRDEGRKRSCRAGWSASASMHGAPAYRLRCNARASAARGDLEHLPRRSRTRSWLACARSTTGRKA